MQAGDNYRFRTLSPEGGFCYDTGKNAFSRYDTQDGVQGSVYYPFASGKGATALLYRYSKISIKSSIEIGIPDISKIEII
jgi:hypothetical protein